MAYGLPLAVGLLSDLGHSADHLVDHVRTQHAKAVAMGLTHATRPTPARDVSVDALEREALADRVQIVTEGTVHSHGGGVHAHDGPVGALMSSADASSEAMESDVAPSSVSTHVPAAFATLEVDVQLIGPSPVGVPTLEIGTPTAPPHRPPARLT